MYSANFVFGFGLSLGVEAIRIKTNRSKVLAFSADLCVLCVSSSSVVWSKPQTKASPESRTHVKGRTRRLERCFLKGGLPWEVTVFKYTSVYKGI